jgi:hypothetical protein
MLAIPRPCVIVQESKESVAIQNPKEVVEMPVKTPRTVEEVLLHHLQAFQSGNVDSIVEDYTPDAVIIGPEGVAKGTVEIRKMSERNITLLPPGSDFKILKKEITEKMAYIVWNADSPLVKIPFGSDTFFIENGMIVSQSFAAEPIPKREIGK